MTAVSAASATAIDDRAFAAQNAPFRIDLPASHSPARESVLLASRARTVMVDWVEQRRADLQPEAQAVLSQMVAEARRSVNRYPRNAETYVRLGLSLLNAGNLEESGAAFQEALACDPGSFSALTGLARLRAAQGRFDEACEHFKLAEAKRPNSVIPLEGLANLATRQGKLDDAIRYWRQAVDIAPEVTSVSYELAMALMAAEQHRRAVAVLRKAVRNGAKSPLPYLGLGVAYAVMRDTDRSVQAFRTALAIQPRLAVAVHGLAAVLLEQRRSMDAVALLEGYLAHRPDDADAGELYAWALMSMRRYSDARTQLFRVLGAISESKAETLVPRARVTNNLGLCFWQNGDPVMAERFFRRSIEACPDEEPIPYLNLARLFLRRQESAAARIVLGECDAHFPDDTDAPVLRAISYELEEKFDKAIGVLEQAIDSDRSSPGAAAVAGALLVDFRHDSAAAIRVLSKARIAYPRDALIANNLAYSFLSCGAIDAAREVLDSAPQCEPTSATRVVLTATRGLLMIHEGHIDEGRAMYLRAQGLASESGRGRLASAAAQKMHLELARAHVRQGNTKRATRETILGLAKTGPSYYRRDLESLLDDLRTNR